MGKNVFINQYENFLLFVSFSAVDIVLGKILFLVALVAFDYHQ